MTAERSEPTYEPLPEDIASWLADHDWQRISQSPDRPALWTLGSRELLQPTLREGSDYELRVSQMLRSLASWSERSVDALAEEMIHEGSDVSEWRVKGLHDRDFSVALEDGLTLVQSVRNAFVAAANATVQRRGYFGHSSLKVAREHARTVRMGQTRRGSYVVPIISRVPGLVEQLDDPQGRFDVDVSAQPFERRVIAQLADGLQAVHDLAIRADREPTPGELVESVGSGVSHELCAALDGVLASGAIGDLEIAFSWARRGARHPDVQRVEFPKAARLVIHGMAENLRGSDVVAEQVLAGTIWQTKYDAGETRGSIKVKAQIGRQIRTVIVPLNNEQIHAAYEAAADDKPVYIRGRLVREQGRSWHFESVSEFGVAEAAPLSWGQPQTDGPTA